MNGGTPWWNWHVEWDTMEDGHLSKIKDVYYMGRTRYQMVEIVELGPYGKSLILDGKIQSTRLDEKIYHEALVHPPMLLHPEPRRILIMGGGEGATAREVLRHSTVERVVMVDLDGELIELVKKYMPEWHLGAFDDERLELVIGDARKYVFENAGTEVFDVIIADLVDPMEGGPAQLLYTKEFYEKVRELVAPGGVFVTQATSPTSTPHATGIIAATLSSVFRNVDVYMTYIRGFDSMWGFVLASDEHSLAELTRKVFEERTLRLDMPLSTIDYDTMVWMRTLPLTVRRALDRYRGTVSTDEKPVYLEV